MDADYEPEADTTIPTTKEHGLRMISARIPLALLSVRTLASWTWLPLRVPLQGLKRFTKGTIRFLT